MLRNLASSLFLTERDDDVNELGEPYFEFETPAMGRNAPAVKGRVVTTLQKAKEVRPLIEKCITIARRALDDQDRADEYATDAERNSDEWRQWRESDQWRKWNAAIAPVVTARRRAIQMLGNKRAVEILFDVIAPRMADRNGGYTRIVRLAEPRLGDAGQRALLELVGTNDRVKQKSEKPAFADDDEPVDETQGADEAQAEDAASGDSPTEEAPAGDTTEPTSEQPSQAAGKSAGDEEKKESDS